MDFSTLLRDLMREQEMTGRGLARQVPCDSALISRVASGKQRPSPRIASRLDEILGAAGALVAARRPCAVRSRAPGWWAGEDKESEDVNRRDALGAMVGGPVGLHLEQLRRNLDSMVHSAASERDAGEWERVVWSYAEEAPTTPAQEYLPHLLADACEITVRLSAAGQVRESLTRSAAKLAALTAIALTSTGEDRTAMRWWRTAVRTSEASNDRALATLIRGNRAVFALYSHRPARDVLDLNEVGQTAYAKWGWRKAGVLQPYPDAPCYNALILPLTGRQ